LLKSIAARGIEARGIELQRLWPVNVIRELRKRRGARTIIFTCGAAHQMKRRHISCVDSSRARITLG
jgi:hypothetical protein